LVGAADRTPGISLMLFGLRRSLRGVPEIRKHNRSFTGSLPTTEADDLNWRYENKAADLLASNDGRTHGSRLRRVSRAICVVDSLDE